jgi:eukaryotic-like serine/threonine-protein kinase
MFCPRCGKQLADSAGRCPACGNGVSTGVLTPPPEVTSTGRSNPGAADAPTIPGGTEPPTIFTHPTAATTSVTRPRGATTQNGAVTSATTSFGAARETSVPSEPPTVALSGAINVPGLDTFVGEQPTAAGFESRDPSDHGPLSIGQVFGSRYHIIRLLGVGGMGAVYHAWDEVLQVAVAIKVIRPEVMADPVAAEDIERRFKRELLLARKVTHPNVVRIHDLGEIDGIKYITMEYVTGADLATLIRQEGSLPGAKTLRVARSVVSGLVAAHAAGVVHRDLKPANIMIDASDEALIMDFGIARSTAEPVARSAPSEAKRSPGRPRPKYTDATAVGSIVGTVEYMAPEQAKGLEVDQRADVYAFGLILYDMLVGRRRSELAGSAFGELQARLDKPLPPVSSIVPEVPEALDRIVSRCIEPDREKRFQTTAEVAAEFDLLDENGDPIPVRRVFGGRVLVAMATLVVALLGSTWYFASKPVAVVEPQPMSVLVADFQNQAEDPVFTGAVEETLTRAIEEASFINIYPREAAARLAEKLRPGGGLNEEVSRLVARSEGVHVLMTGTIARQGPDYVISVRAIDPSVDESQAKPLAVVTASASTREKALKTVAALGARIRGPLGDTTPESVRLAAAETFTTSSPEAVKSYTLAQELLFAGRTTEALETFKRATEQDPKFGRAYSSAAIAARELGRQDETRELWKKALSLMERMSEREKYRMLGAYSMTETRNYQQAISNFSTLVEKYPADRVGRASLALAYFWALNIPKALEEGKRALELDPRSTIVRANYALYAMYAGEFDTAVDEMKQIIAKQPSVDLAYVPLAVAALVKGDSKQARDAYDAMSATGEAGASRASMGLADMALYEGRYADAAAILAKGIAADEKSGNVPGAAVKHTALAEAYEGQGKIAAAVAEARKAVHAAEGKPLQVLAAAVLIRAGQDREAKALAASFSQRLTPESRAYGKILEGLIAMKDRRMAEAVDAFTGAQKFADLWLARFQLGVAYVEAGHFAEGLGELERCLKRRGEATAIFLDEMPSFRYLVALPYWVGRAQQELGMGAEATTNYKAYIALRASAPRDRLALDAKKRLGS